MYYTREQTQQAKSIPILDYLKMCGVKVKRKGRDYCTEEHDSLSIDPQTQVFAWNSRTDSKTGKAVGGKGVVDYILKVEKECANPTKADFLDAIGKLLSMTHGQYTYLQSNVEHAKKKEPEKSKHLVLPQREESSLRQLYGYLCKTRCLDRDIVTECVKNKSIFLSREPVSNGREIHNVVFVGRDAAGVAKYATRRGTLTDKAFKRDCYGSDKSYGFRVDGKSDKLLVFESPIDALSFATLEKMKGADWKAHTLLSIGCVADVALQRFLDDNPKSIKQIRFYTDNDEAGNAAAQKYMAKYAAKGYEVRRSLPPEGKKDVNEYLKSIVNVKQNMQEVLR